MPRKQLSSDEFKAVIESERAKLNNLTSLDVTVMVNVSGGAASAITWHRMLQLIGKDRCRPVFADTHSEDESTYQFLDDLEKAFDQPIVRLSQTNLDGSPMDIWDCFHHYGMMRIAKAGNACKASVELKQKPLDKYADSHGLSHVAVGYGYTEAERMVNLNNAKEQTCYYPLVIKPVLSECEMIDELSKFGVTPPQPYEDGFIHNNCLAAGGCILSGLAQFAAVRKLKPEAFAYAQEQERKFVEKTGFTILRDQRNGDVTPYTLDQLEEDAENGRDFGNDWNSKCNCMSPPLFSFDDCSL